MLGFLKILLVLPIAVVVILLAVANRAPVMLSLDPFAKGAPEIGMAIPLYAVIFGAVAFGVLLGGVATWFGAGARRRSGRTSRREVERLKEEADRLRRSLASARNPALPSPSAR